MNSRRKFLRNTALSSLVVLPFNTENILSSGENPFESFQKQKNFLSEAEYWKAVRMQFPLKQGQTYFNNATLGPLPDYTMSRMIEDMRENAKKRFTIMGFWEKYKDFIQMTVFIFIVFLALYINWMGLKDIVVVLARVADSLKGVPGVR